MKCEYCRLNKVTHCGYFGGTLPGKCGYGVADIDKMIGLLADRDARIAVLTDFIKEMFCKTHCEFNKGECFAECVVYKALSGKENK